MVLGHDARTERLIAAASRLAGRHPGLTERVARWRLVQGRPDVALAMADAASSRKPRASLRLLRATCLLSLGRESEAHLDLLSWSRKASAPLKARVMLALLEWRHGRPRDGIRLLRRNLNHLDDQTSRDAAVAICVSSGRDDLANKFANEAATTMLTDAESRRSAIMRETLGLATPKAQIASSPDTIRALATELIACEPAIRVLVEAQQRQPDTATLKLLIDAVELALPELADEAAALEAMAKIDVLLDRRVDALSCVERALELNPLSASLELLHQDLTVNHHAASPRTRPADRGQAA